MINIPDEKAKSLQAFARQVFNHDDFDEFKLAVFENLAGQEIGERFKGARDVFNLIAEIARPKLKPKKEEDEPRPRGEKDPDLED